MVWRNALEISFKITEVISLWLSLIWFGGLQKDGNKYLVWILGLARVLTMNMNQVDCCVRAWDFHDIQNFIEMNCTSVYDSGNY